MSTEPTELNARPTDAADAKEVGPADINEAKSVAGRRRFLRWFGRSDGLRTQRLGHFERLEIDAQFVDVD